MRGHQMRASAALWHTPVELQRVCRLGQVEDLQTMMRSPRLSAGIDNAFPSDQTVCRVIASLFEPTSLLYYLGV